LGCEPNGFHAFLFRSEPFVSFHLRPLLTSIPACCNSSEALFCFSHRRMGFYRSVFGHSEVSILDNRNATGNNSIAWRTAFGSLSNGSQRQEAEVGCGKYIDAVCLVYEDTKVVYSSPNFSFHKVFRHSNKQSLLNRRDIAHSDTETQPYRRSLVSSTSIFAL